MADENNKDRLDCVSPNPAKREQQPPIPGTRFYEIRLKGHLPPSWSDWLGGLEIRLLEDGEMILFGPIIDQSALMGVLNKLVHLNLALISVNEVNKRESSEEK